MASSTQVITKLARGTSSLAPNFFRPLALFLLSIDLSRAPPPPPHPSATSIKFFVDLQRSRLPHHYIAMFFSSSSFSGSVDGRLDTSELIVLLKKTDHAIE